jgi:dTDP-4-amino-4,6-dideoxygalactose transaminase
MDEELALFGGAPAIGEPFAPYPSLGNSEVEAVTAVVRSGCLSSFYGSWGDQFLGGPRILEFEKAWSQHFRVKHAVTMNSATSCLTAALGAISILPGDEVIVPPYTMSATAIAPLMYGGIPVFVDIDPMQFCLDVELVRASITPRTKAITAVNLFGHPARLTELRKLADEAGIWLIEDNAQGPLAKENGQFTGTIGHIGIFSLNYHKHIHTGEGGICVTNDPELALRLQMIRNHGENIVEHVGLRDITNIVGFNYRMTELSAAIGITQLANIDNHVGRRVELARYLTEGLSDLPGLTPPAVRENCEHVYYGWPMKFDASVVGISRERFSQALLAEGVPHGTGYVRPLYMLPLFQQRRAFGDFPFTHTNRTYPKGLCPVAELLHQHELIVFEVCAYDLTKKSLDSIIAAFQKVYSNRKRL